MADSILAVPSLFSFWLLAFVFALHARYVYLRLDAGDFARLQLYTCIGGFISAVGSCVHALGFYGLNEPNSRWCEFEAVCSSFGELSVICWLIMTCVYFYAHLKEYTVSAVFRRRLFVAFHCSVWFPAGVLTIIPAGLGVLGMNTDQNSEFWCWFKPDHNDWEWAQFYAPLVLYSVVSVVTFIFCLAIILRRLKSPLAATNNAAAAAAATAAASNGTSGTIADTAGGGTGDAEAALKHETDLTLYMRLALQFFVLFVVFLPDLFVVLVDTYPEEVGTPATDSGGNGSGGSGGTTHPHGESKKSLYAGSRGAEFLWKCEGLMVGLLYLLNSRVRTLFWCLPEVHAISLYLNPAASVIRAGSTAPTASSSLLAHAASTGGAAAPIARRRTNYSGIDSGVEVVGTKIGGSATAATTAAPVIPQTLTVTPHASTATTNANTQATTASAAAARARASKSGGVHDRPRQVEEDEDDDDDADTDTGGGGGDAGDSQRTEHSNRRRQRVGSTATDNSGGGGGSSGGGTSGDVLGRSSAIDHSHDDDDNHPPPVILDLGGLRSDT